MIRGIQIMNEKGDLLNLKLEDPWSTGINVKNVTGISPPPADIFSTPYGSLDGGVYAGSRVPTRTVVFTLGLMFHPQVEDSRMILYNFFRIKDPVSIMFFTDSRELIIDGYVDSNDVDIFSQNETATVSVTCVDPWFHSLDKTKYRMAGIVPKFEFPFSSELDGSDLIEFSDISIDTRTNIVYEGDIQTGFVGYFTFTSGNFHNIYLYNMQTRERMTLYTDQVALRTGTPLGRGDEIQISTISGQKTAYLLRDGVLYNIIGMVDKDSTWLQLTKGDNIFAIASDNGVENIGFSLTYQDKYAGI